MAIAIPLDRVQQVLAIRIGTALAHSGAGTHAAERLRHYRVGDDLSALCEALRDGLFRDLYAILGPQMRVSMPDGRTRRFRMEEFPRWRMSCLPSSLNPSAQPECRKTR